MLTNKPIKLFCLLFCISLIGCASWFEPKDYKSAEVGPRAKLTVKKDKAALSKLKQESLHWFHDAVTFKIGQQDNDCNVDIKGWIKLLPGEEYKSVYVPEGRIYIEVGAWPKTKQLVCFDLIPPPIRNRLFSGP